MNQRMECSGLRFSITRMTIVRWKTQKFERTAVDVARKGMSPKSRKANWKDTTCKWCRISATEHAFVMLLSNLCKISLCKNRVWNTSIGKTRWLFTETGQQTMSKANIHDICSWGGSCRGSCWSSCWGRQTTTGQRVECLFVHSTWKQDSWQMMRRTISSSR